MKVWVSYLLIALFSLQQLPVKELSKLLAKKTCTEQSCDNDCADDDAPAPAKQLKEKADLDKYLAHTNNLQLQEVAISHSVEIALHEAQRLVPHFVPDILTPPPNQA